MTNNNVVGYDKSMNISKFIAVNVEIKRLSGGVIKYELHSVAAGDDREELEGLLKRNHFPNGIVLNNVNYVGYSTVEDGVEAYLDNDTDLATLREHFADNDIFYCLMLAVSARQGIDKWAEMFEKFCS